MLSTLIRSTLSHAWMGAVLLCIGWPLNSQSPAPAAASSKDNRAAASTRPGSDANEFTISANVDLVLLDVSVKDSEGGFVSNLSRDAFTVIEDGKPQTITQFANQDVPVTMGIIVDNSGSMRSKKPEVVTAAIVMIQASNPQDESFVINFNDTVRRGLPDMIPFTDDIPKLREALAKTDPVGRTALYDAVIAGLNQLDMGRRDKKTLVVISDGGDNISTHTWKETQNAALASRATIYTVGLFDESDKDRNPDILRQLAKISGGVCYIPDKLSEVMNICRQIAKDIRSRYTIGYVPQGLAKSGVRHIKVEAHSPDRVKLVARTRTSYKVSEQVQSTDRVK